jgi:hypothetical protein
VTSKSIAWLRARFISEIFMVVNQGSSINFCYVISFANFTYVLVSDGHFWELLLDKI